MVQHRHNQFRNHYPIFRIFTAQYHILIRNAIKINVFQNSRVRIKFKFIKSKTLNHSFEIRKLTSNLKEKLTNSFIDVVLTGNSGSLPIIVAA